LDQRGSNLGDLAESARDGPMAAVERAAAFRPRPGGNADRADPQVTLLDAGRWRGGSRARASVDPRGRRANIFTEGIDYREQRGRVLRVGAVRIRVRGETRPCERMDEAHPGLRTALEPDWRAGAYGELLDDGEIAVGDAVEWAEPE
jgi:MOSC domain-containing protein YiiM